MTEHQRKIIAEHEAELRERLVRWQAAKSYTRKLIRENAAIDIRILRHMRQYVKGEAQ